MLRAVCLDLMGVLLYDPYLEALEAACGLDVATAHRLKDPDCWPQFEVAAIDEAEFARRFFAGRDGMRFDLEAFHRVRLAGYRFLPGMEELLDHLEGVVARYVASNYPVWIEDLRVRFGLDRRCEGIYASHQLGVRKPDPDFYRRLLEAVRLPPPTCLFVDDREVNCAAAEAAGMRAHVFSGAGDLRRRLCAEGVSLVDPA
jgi:HAD superfamily hydrolase (TIGR01509 family)